MLAQIAIGAAHGCVVKTDGTVLCWGSNNLGQLGTSGGDQGTPVAAAVLGHVRAAVGDHSIAAGDNHTCVIASAGDLVLCWGATSASVIPLSGVTALSAAGNDTCARVGADENASFYCWGTAPQRVDVNAANLPAAVLPLLDAGAPLVTNMTASNVVGLSSTSFTHIATAAEHSCGITTDNHVKCWEGTHASVDIPML
jgi:alpha-tubulin suppressor-like RCC1 family protein